jgi:peptidoglycan/LPS O-acetylase OafA/YrhL
LVTLGEVSYGVYVLHVPILYWLVEPVGWERAADLGLWFFALYTGVIVAAATVSYFRFEEPVRVWIRSRFDGSRRTGAAVHLDDVRSDTQPR